eukprot:gene13404-4269_t
MADVDKKEDREKDEREATVQSEYEPLVAEPKSKDIDLSGINDDTADDEAMVELDPNEATQKQPEIVEKHPETTQRDRTLFTVTSSNIQSANPTKSQLISKNQDVAFFLQKKDISVEELIVGVLHHWRPTNQEDCSSSYDASAKCNRRVSLVLLQEEDGWLTVS